LLMFLLPLLTSRAMRVAAVAMAALSLVMVSIARVALNVHHPSDVIAGWALGYLYFLLCLWAFRPPPLNPCGPVLFGRSRRGDTTGSKPLLDPKAGAH
jgi:membrane-associated phospholipid phosphatase